MKWLLGFASLPLVAAFRSGRSGSGSPVENVVKLLEDLKTKLEDDGTSEQQLYDKFACWCEETGDKKAKAITDAQEKIRSLGQGILSDKGTVATALSEISDLTKKIKENEEGQQKATALREKENARYMAESTEMKEVLAALTKALEVLKDGTSFLQHGASAAAAAKNAVRGVVDLLPEEGGAKTQQLAQLRSFLKDGYAPQSATIQGILMNMFDTFSGDLESVTEAEGKKNEDFEVLMADKAGLLRGFQRKMRKEEKKKVEAEISMAEGTEAYDNTKKQLDADVAFFDKTKETCLDKHKEFSTRKSLRAEEMAGIEKALEILTSDDARELFGKAIKPGRDKVDKSIDTSFLQTSAGGAAPAEKALAAVKKAARAGKSLRLAAVAAKIKLAEKGHFDEVIADIDTLISTLKDEFKEDIEKRDQCKKEYTKINSTLEDLAWKLEKNDAKIEKLADLIDKLKDDKKEVVKSIADTEKEIEDMEKAREAENDEFKQAKKDDQDAIKLLEEAKEAFVEYYKKNDVDVGAEEAASLAQEDPKGPEFKRGDHIPEVKFSKKGSRKLGGKGILSLMDMIITDLEDEIRAGKRDEELAQKDFEERKKVAEDLKTALEEKKVGVEDAIAERTEQKDDEEKDKEANEKDEKAEKDHKKKIEPDCDWILEAFSKRTEQRQAEMDGLVTAKEFLAGYEAPSLLEKKAHFDDSALASVDFKGLR